jgi:hypothetical protein
MAKNRKVLLYLGVLPLVALLLAALGYQGLDFLPVKQKPRAANTSDGGTLEFNRASEEISLAGSMQLAAQQTEIARLKEANREIPKLREEVARLAAQSAKSAPPQAKGETEPAEDAFEAAVKELAARAAELNRHVQNMPNLDIPELQLLEESDWLSAAKGADFDTQEGIRQALSKVRQKAKTQFAELATAAFNDYYAATRGSAPTDPAQLLPYFKTPIDAALLQRYQLVPSSTVQSLMEIGPVLLSEKAPVDRQYDTHFYIGRKGVASFALGPTGSNDPDTTWATR